jgi:hypothetical protein
MENILQETVAILNEILGIKPILFASFATEKVMGRSYHAHDIDLLIPVPTTTQKEALIQEFAEHGFSYLDQYVGTFTKDGIDVELSDRDVWFKFCGFETKSLYEISGATFSYDLMGAENLLRLYRFLLTYPKRDPKKFPKDRIKINDLCDALEHHTTNFR